MGTGGKYGQQNARQSRRDARQRRAQSVVEQKFQRPDRSEWDLPEEFSFPLSAKSRFFVKTFTYRGRCVHFSISHQVGGPYRWRDLFRIDSTHDSVHRHDFTSGHEVREEIEPITDLEVTDRHYTQQYSYMLATWQQRERTWANG